MVNLRFIKTDQGEEELLFQLIARGQNALQPYYFSVHSYDLDTGVVHFTRLDCAPAESFRVAVIGNKLIVSENYQSEVMSWLAEWGFQRQLKETERVSSPDKAYAFVAQMRDRNGTVASRARIKAAVEKRISGLVHEL
jgi:hypothetical protein